MEQFTKDDLKTGMKVVTRNGDEYIVFKDTNRGENGEFLLGIGKNLNAPYNNDLTSSLLARYDIVEIFVASHPVLIEKFFSMKSIDSWQGEWKLVWKREENNKEDKQHIDTLLDNLVEGLTKMGIDLNNITLELSSIDFNKLLDITEWRGYKYPNIVYHGIHGDLRIKIKENKK